jgi:hypothetical protein
VTRVSPFAAILARPADVEVETWFGQIAAAVLGQWRLVIEDRLHRFVEIEFYFHGPAHEDPFAHAHPIQLLLGRWYFHRIGASYRGGSFKGVDLTFGDGVSTGGILIRSLESPDGFVIGPSLCVDYLLRATGSATVAALDAAIGPRLAWNGAGPLSIVTREAASTTIFSSRRVGLTLKRHKDALAVDRLARRYRFLSEPRRVTKGRVELIEALIADGKSTDEIRILTGSPKGAVEALRPPARR